MRTTILKPFILAFTAITLFSPMLKADNKRKKPQESIIKIK